MGNMIENSDIEPRLESGQWDLRALKGNPNLGDKRPLSDSKPRQRVFFKLTRPRSILLEAGPNPRKTTKKSGELLHQNTNKAALTATDNVNRWIDTTGDDGL